MPGAPPSTDDVRAALAGVGIVGPERVVVREMHISRVFLAGDRAYKLKKPVVLPFLDSGTPQRRREMCREEARLNRRLAPDVYIGVRALAATAGGVELVAEDDSRAVDYVVEMRRYDESCTLAARLAPGELACEGVVALAGILAGFHEHAPRVDAVGVPALALERFAHAFVAAHSQMLAARARSGWSREGHGDLRAEHVLFEDGRVQIVDCVEFDRGLRELDVADDLAFLVMDLTAQGGGHVADTLMCAYREAGGGDALIAFYATYRALVRAKVAPDAQLTVRTDRPVDTIVGDILGLLDQRAGRLTVHAEAPC